MYFYPFDVNAHNGRRHRIAFIYTINYYYYYYIGFVLQNKNFIFLTRDFRMYTQYWYIFIRKNGWSIGIPRHFFRIKKKPRFTAWNLIFTLISANYHRITLYNIGFPLVYDWMNIIFMARPVCVNSRKSLEDIFTTRLFYRIVPSSRCLTATVFEKCIFFRVPDKIYFMMTYFKFSTSYFYYLWYPLLRLF